MAAKRKASSEASSPQEERSIKSRRSHSHGTSLQGKDTHEAGRGKVRRESISGTSSTHHKKDTPTGPASPIADFIHEAIDEDNANEALQDLIDLIKQLTGAQTSVSFSDFSKDFVVIKAAVSNFLTRIANSHDFVQPTWVGEYDALSQRYEHFWRTAAITAWRQRCDLLNASTSNEPIGRIELMFSEFANDIQVLRRLPPAGINAQAWDAVLPEPVDDPTVQSWLRELEEMYRDFQNARYPEHELTNLWLLVWRTLRAIWLQWGDMPGENLGPNDEPEIDELMVERSFFASRGSNDYTPNSERFNAIIDVGELSNQKAIESIVHDYCTHLADYQHNKSANHYWQFKLLNYSPLTPGYASSLWAFALLDREWKREYHILLHRVTLRLNHLLSNQRPLSRWWREEGVPAMRYLDPQDYPRSSNDAIDKGKGKMKGRESSIPQEYRNMLDSNGPIPTPAQIYAFMNTSTGNPILPGTANSDTKATAEQERQSLKAQFTHAVPENSLVDTSMPGLASVTDDPEDQTLERRVLSSAFPYVNYPLAETRASEVAMSRQISREMREPGIVTDGPHVEDVQNIVPRPLRLPDIATVNPGQSDTARPGFLRRYLNAVSGLFRRDTPVVPESLPKLPSTPRRNARRDTGNVLSPNRDGTSGVQRARERASGSARSPRYSLHNSTFNATRSWVLNRSGTFPWQEANQAPNQPVQRPLLVQIVSQDAARPFDNRHDSTPNPNQPAKNPASLPSVGTPARPASAVRPLPAVRPASATSPVRRGRDQGTYIVGNTIGYPVSPSRQGGPGIPRNEAPYLPSRPPLERVPETGADTPSDIAPLGDGLFAEPQWRWLPEDHEQGRVFDTDDRERQSRGDGVRRRSWRLFHQLMGQHVGQQAVILDLYQLMRLHFEYGLTGQYTFNNLAPGIWGPPAGPPRTPPSKTYPEYRGGRGSPHGWLDSTHFTESSEAVVDAGGNSQGGSTQLGGRQPPPPSAHSWQGGANGGDQDFQLYESPNNPDSQEQRPPSDTSIAVLREQVLRSTAQGSGSGSSWGSTLPPLGSPVRPVDPTLGEQPERNRRHSSSTAPTRHIYYPAVPTRAVADAPATAPPPQALPTREAYMNMTVVQLQREIMARGGNTKTIKKAKKDLVDALEEFDRNGNYGNGAAPRKTKRGGKRGGH